MMLELLGAVAIVSGLVGTWLAGRQRIGWLVCIVSSTLWLPTPVTGAQWAAIANCAVSVGICAHNFRTGRERNSLGQHLDAEARRARCGGQGIRTLDELALIAVFKTAAIGL